MRLWDAPASHPAVHWQHHAHADGRAEVVVTSVGQALRIVVGDLGGEAPSDTPPAEAPGPAGAAAQERLTLVAAGASAQHGRPRLVLDRRGRLARLAGADTDEPSILSDLSDPCLQVAVDDVCRAGTWLCALGVDLAADGTVTVAGSGGPGAIVARTGRPGRLVPEVPDGRPHVVRLAPPEVLVLCTPAYLADPPEALRRLRLGVSPSAALRHALLDRSRPGAVAVVRHTPSAPA